MISTDICQLRPTLAIGRLWAEFDQSSIDFGPNLGWIRPTLADLDQIWTEGDHTLQLWSHVQDRHPIPLLCITDGRPTRRALHIGGASVWGGSPLVLHQGLLHGAVCRDEGRSRFDPDVAPTRHPVALRLPWSHWSRPRGSRARDSQSSRQSEPSGAAEPRTDSEPSAPNFGRILVRAPLRSSSPSERAFELAPPSATYPRLRACVCGCLSSAVPRARAPKSLPRTRGSALGGSSASSCSSPRSAARPRPQAGARRRAPLGRAQAWRAVAESAGDAQDAPWVGNGRDYISKRAR